MATKNGLHTPNSYGTVVFLHSGAGRNMGFPGTRCAVRVCRGRQPKRGSSTDGAGLGTGPSGNERVRACFALARRVRGGKNGPSGRGPAPHRKSFSTTASAHFDFVAQKSCLGSPGLYSFKNCIRIHGMVVCLCSVVKTCICVL